MRFIRGIDLGAKLTSRHRRQRCPTGGKSRSWQETIRVSSHELVRSELERVISGTDKQMRRGALVIESGSKHRQVVECAADDLDAGRHCGFRVAGRNGDDRAIVEHVE